MTRLNEWAARHGVSPRALAELRTLYDVPPTSAVDGSEAATQAALRITAAQHGCSLWRNNSGAAMDDTGRVVRYGLENISKKLNDVFKSSDLIGVARGRFVAVEVKAPGWPGPSTAHEHAQANFLRTVESFGGIGMFCTDVSQYVDRIGKL